MTKEKEILIAVVCLSVVAVAGLMLSPLRAADRRPMPLFPPWESLRGLTDEEKAEAIERWQFERRQQRLRSGEERMDLMEREAWQWLLRITEPQWRVIEPEDAKVGALYRTMWAGALAWGSSNKEIFRWYKYSEGTGGFSARTPQEITEGERLADEFADLLNDPNSTDEQIRKKKINALQQLREQARKEFPKAKRELAAVLTTPRQEAVFLIRGWID